jgi:mannose-6-phosphate isomerase-like protein (cupin superfamily)
MDLNSMKESIVTKVYHLTAKTKVPLHAHAKQDEVFYCIKGSGFGVLEDREEELVVGKAFIVPAGIMHSLRSEEDLYVSSFLIPVVAK